MKGKLFGDKKSGPTGLGATVDFSGAQGPAPNADFKFSKISGDHDFHLMISKEQE